MLKRFGSKKDSTLKTVLKNAYPNRSYKEVFEIGVANALELLNALPCYVRNDIETLAFFYHIGNITVLSVGGNIAEYEKQIRDYIHLVIPDSKWNLFTERAGFYWLISHGEKVKGFWSISDLPRSILVVPMLRCAAAFGDCITNPEMIEDYDDAPVLIQDIFEQTEFSYRFQNDFFRLVHTYCVMVAGREFDPPVLTETDD